MYTIWLFSSHKCLATDQTYKSERKDKYKYKIITSIHYDIIVSFLLKAK